MMMQEDATVYHIYLYVLCLLGTAVPAI